LKTGTEESKLDGGEKLGDWGPPGSVRICGAQLSEREREIGEIGARRTFCTAEQTGRQHVMQAWLATCAKVVKL